MYSPRTQLETPSVFEFPHTPYDIQQQLMESLYAVLEHKRIGIFESPTGTGKSLTLTCAALRWLLDHEALVRQDLQSRLAELSDEIRLLDENSAKASDWITAQYASTQRREELSELQRLSSLLTAYEQKLQQMRERQSETKQQVAQSKTTANVDVIVEYDDLYENLQLDDLEDTTGSSLDNSGAEEEENKRYRDVKIYFCSRTHSQLAQVVREVKRSAYGQRIRCVSVASRQQLCIHPHLRRLPSVAVINERCLDMANSGGGGSKSKVTVCTPDGCTQKKTRLGNCKCAFKAPQALQQLSESALLQIHDIEDLVTAGERNQACPYYAARAATHDAQLIMLPYQLLLHRKTRQQSGIDLRDAVIIIDEAHNLLDTIAQIYSAEITLPQLMHVQQHITAYKMRYATRLSTANLLKINQLNFIVKRLIKILMPSATATESRMLRTHELMSEGEFFNINVFHILEFCERTRFAQKLQGFAQRLNQEPQPNENQQPDEPANSATLDILKKLQHEQQQRVQQGKRNAKESPQETTIIAEVTVVSGQRTTATTTTSAIRPLLAFLETLTESADDGRVLVSTQPPGANASRSYLKYVLLNPGGHFEEVVRAARAIVIAGGTMQPTAELTDQLFKACPDRVVQQFYDHVVPADAVLPLVVSKGPMGKTLCFNYAQRNSVDMLSELGMTLQNLCNVIPDGIVCFLPSYDFMETVKKHLQQTGFLERIAQKKHIFHEARAASSAGQSVEQLLLDYAKAIKGKERNGALLFSVVGGKLSEGLNFADELGRCVIVVGMPYPNRNSPELQERMKYLDGTLGAGAGSEYYENLCMKSVNQCIGRAVRHIRDYACVLLLDERYAKENIQRKLPKWIGRSLKMPTTFGMVQGATAKFFKEKRLVA